MFITLGFFLEPPAWIDQQEVRLTDYNFLKPHECKEIVYSANLDFGVDLFVWRQGFIGARFSESFIGQDLNTFDPDNGISKIEIARMPLIFFNAFLYIFYDEKLESKHGSSWTLKQPINLTNIYIFSPSRSDDLISTAQAIAMPLSLDFSLDFPIKQIEKIQGILAPEHQMMMPTWPISAVNNTVRKLQKVFSFRPDMLEYIALLNSAVYFLQKGQLSQSLILSWAVAEKCISILWQDYWNNKPTGPTNKQQKTKGNILVEKIEKTEWRVAKRIELLEFEQIISAELYYKLVSPRKARNDWIHDLQSVVYTDALESHSCANELLQKVTDISLPHPGAFPL